MKLFKVIVICISFIILVLGGSFYYLSPAFHPFPKPAGIYGIGDTSYQLRDASHDFMVRCWYPADILQQHFDRYGDTKINAYAITQLAQITHIPKLLLYNSFKFSTYSQLNAPLSASHETYPVILFLPGNGASYHHYTALIGDLVSHGYMVIGINTSPINPTEFLDGRFIGHDNNFLSQEDGIHHMIDRCVANALFVADWLATINNDSRSIWYRRIDMHRLGIMGHSFGGSAAVEVARQNRHFGVGIDLDGWLKMKTTNEIPIPFLFLMNDSAYPLGKDEGMAEIEQTCALSANSCKVQIVSGAGHNSFSDIAFFKWPLNKLGDPGKGDPYALLKEIGNKIMDFLKVHFNMAT